MTRATHLLVITTRKPSYHTTRATGCGRPAGTLLATTLAKAVNCVTCRRHLRRLARLAIAAAKP